ncbi:adhesive plaque matrix protein 2-like isoform X2 [Haliotis rubra]|uniref:adhesive plaque matrix protein 2-like isoform X2 n=1 Tax=Haliotis rubra TaxID=36100 RepID=UPI001EE5072D|nr:adhesive plaque matrix protein 2-like isoform X2 [Haliotis rubra]
MSKTSGNACRKIRCLNGGVCRSRGSKGRCYCKAQFRGKRCQKRGGGRNPCRRVRCRNGGTCRYSGKRWKCFCKRGFRGSKCRKPVGGNACRKIRCLNGGVCRSRGSKGRCYCKAQFRGKRCQKRGGGRNPCRRVRCRNGGTCRYSGKRWKCFCKRGFRGSKCRKPVGGNACRKIRCLNGGVCRSRGSKGRCYCKAQFRGKRCQKRGGGRNPCRRVRCRNGGTCRYSGKRWKCFCKRGFRGSKCRKPVGGFGLCNRRLCRNGGTCKQIGKSLRWVCLCRRGFSGMRCERRVGCRQRKLDILIVEDVSNSIGTFQYSSVKRFEQQMLKTFDISSQTINVAFLVFSVNARVVFPLNAYSNNKRGVLAAVDSQRNEGGASTHIGEAVKLANTDVFTRRNGDRPDADNMIIFFTDAEGTCDDKLVVAANIGYLQAKSEIFVVFTKEHIESPGRNITISALASDPDNKHAFHVDHPDSVDAITKSVIACKAP